MIKWFGFPISSDKLGVLTVKASNCVIVTVWGFHIFFIFISMSNMHGHVTFWSIRPNALILLSPDLVFVRHFSPTVYPLINMWQFKGLEVIKSHQWNMEVKNKKWLLLHECNAPIPYRRLNHLFDDYHLLLSVKDLFKVLTSSPVVLCVGMNVDPFAVLCKGFVVGTKRQPEQRAVQAIGNKVVWIKSVQMDTFSINSNLITTLCHTSC